MKKMQKYKVKYMNISQDYSWNKSYLRFWVNCGTVTAENPEEATKKINNTIKYDYDKISTVKFEIENKKGEKEYFIADDYNIKPVFEYKKFRREMRKKGHEIYKKGKYITIYPNNGEKGFLNAYSIIKPYDDLELVYFDHFNTWVYQAKFKIIE